MNRNRDLDSAGTGRRQRDTALAGPDPLTPERDPSTQSRVVRREALFERLSAAPADCVALVCAPAGSGKTMLVRSWLEADGLSERTAWVAVEPRERDAQHFWLVGDRRARRRHRAAPSSGSARRRDFAARPWSSGCSETFARLKSRSCW